MLTTSTKTVTFAISVWAGRSVSTAGELLPAKQRAQGSDGGMLSMWQSQNLLPVPMSPAPPEMMGRMIVGAGQREIECRKELLTQGIAQGSHSAGASCVEPGKRSARKYSARLGQQQGASTPMTFASLGISMSLQRWCCCGEPCLWRSLPQWTAQSWSRLPLMAGEKLCC